jgi:hypothetical protein
MTAPKQNIPKEPIVDGTPKISLVKEMAKAIQTFEGYAPPVSRSYRNRNPGNLKMTTYVKSLGATGKDAHGFAIFPTYEAGFQALCQFISDAGHNLLGAYKDCDIYKFFSVYAPAHDANNPTRYAEFVASQMGIEPTEKVANIV